MEHGIIDKDVDKLAQRVAIYPAPLLSRIIINIMVLCHLFGNQMT